ncbi:unnamed protein product [Rangifer tarandus platyrhynchus]|uniref:Uncharacterized protein n=2 Tax=Rangifer tarandus platyrhynchus TaxID=3082113 RepID=A0AC59ZXS3_RANTA|nr:unnamed protein product [Rangifer tarandus platyrhynchus]
MEEVCSVFNKNFGLGRKKRNSTYISLKMGKFVISFNKMSKGRTGSICSTPGLCLHLSVLLFALSSLLSASSSGRPQSDCSFQVSFSDATVSRETDFFSPKNGERLSLRSL